MNISYSDLEESEDCLYLNVYTPEVGYAIIIYNVGLKKFGKYTKVDTGMFRVILK